MLDFTPFEAGLAQLSAERVAALERQLQAATISNVQAMFAAGSLTAEELLLYYVQRIRTYDAGRLNTIIELNPEALQIARQLDAERRAGNSRGRLHGIPVLLKDNIATADQMHTTAGALAMQTAQADRDAFIVQRLRSAGAIILGKANLTEWANFMTKDSVNGFSAVGGQTRNPYGAFDTGGSSSGSAAAVAADFATIAIGTETAGSLTSPASQNSLVTIKPSLGLVSRDRIIPITSKMDTAGPLARTVADATILLTAIAGEDPRDPLTKAARPLAGTDFTRFLDSDGLQGKRVGIVMIEQYKQAGYEEILARVTPLLETAGAEVVRIPFERPDVDYIPILLYGIRHEVNAYLDALGPHAPVQSMAEVVAFNQADIEVRAPYGQNFLEESLTHPMTAAEYDALAERNQATAARAIQDALRGHRVDMLLTVANTFAGVYAPAGFPAVSVPAGYLDTGQSVNITFVGDYLDDGRLIAAAYAFEQVSHLRRPPDLEARIEQLTIHN